MRVLPLPGAKLPESGLLSYGFQRSPTHRHNGIDLPAREGRSVLAPADGAVMFATHAWRQGFTGYGRVVVLWHKREGVYTLYAHLLRPTVSVGQYVSAGSIIGQVGRTQYAKHDHESLLKPGASHLHFEVAPAKYPMASNAPRLDPVAWLRGEPAAPLPPSTPVASSTPGAGGAVAIAVALASAALS